MNFNRKVLELIRLAEFCSLTSRKGLESSPSFYFTGGVQIRVCRPTRGCKALPAWEIKQSRQSELLDALF